MSTVFKLNPFIFFILFKVDFMLIKRKSNAHTLGAACCCGSDRWMLLLLNKLLLVTKEHGQHFQQKGRTALDVYFIVFNIDISDLRNIR